MQSTPGFYGSPPAGFTFEPYEEAFLARKRFDSEGHEAFQRTFVRDVIVAFHDAHEADAVRLASFTSSPLMIELASFSKRGLYYQPVPPPCLHGGSHREAGPG